MESLTIFSLCFCPLALFIFILFFNHHRHPPLLTHKPRQRLTPPGPRQFPVIGNIPHLLLASRESQLPHHCFRRLSQTYGPLLHLKLGQMSLVVASTPEAAREVVKTHDVLFATRPLFTAVKIFSYDGQSMSFAPYGDYWRQLRRICILELLSPKRIQSFRSIREEEVQNLIQSIYNYLKENKDERSIVNLSKELSSLTNNIMARAAVGIKYCEDQTAFLAALQQAFEISGGFPLEDMFPSWSWLIGLVSGFKGKVERCHQNFDRILDGIIQQHKIKMKKSTATRESKEEEVEDLLDLLLRLQEDGGLEFELTTVRIKAVILVRKLVQLAQ